MINRENVAACLAPDGLARLEALEEAGYAVVRAGLVPQISQVDHVVARLDDVTACDPHAMIADAEQAKDALDRLTQLSCAFLGIDPWDFDPPVGEKS